MKYILFIEIILIGITLSCRNPFAPALTDGDVNSPRLLTEQKTPEEVLQNFKFAYTFRDSLIYSEVLDSTFIFRSWDYNSYPPVPLEWGRDTDLRITARMFRYFNTLDLTWNTIIAQNDDTEEPEYRVTFTLTLDGGRSIPILNGEVLFRFILRGKKYYISLWRDEKI